MSAKPVSLSAHNSQIERRRRREVKQDMVRSCRGIGNAANIVAYSIVAFSDDGRAFCQWDTGGIVPMWAFAPTVKEALAEDMAQANIPEDFKRPLLDTSWKGNKP